MARDKDAPGKTPPRDKDSLLWEKVARTVSPLTRGRDRLVPDAGERKAEKPEPPARPQKKSRAVTPVPPAPVKPAGPPPLNRFDVKEERRLGTGRIEIDARIDLHGMRQRDAHATLRAFLIGAQQRGHKIVLVITGKGAPKGNADDFTTDGPRGVLRRAVPLWLDEPELRQIVVSHTSAHSRHGGDGALYVRLRKAGGETGRTG